MSNTNMQIFLQALVFCLINCQNDFDYELSNEIFQYSRVAYCTIDQIIQWNCIPCKRNNLTEISIIQNQDIKKFAYIGYNSNQNRIVIAFRGTENQQDWYFNLNILQTEYTDCVGCQVHKGFYKRFQIMEQDLMEQVQKLIEKYKDSQIIITGHSLGAVMASFLSLSIVKKFNKMPILYNYGSPRLGNKNFAKYFSKILPDSIRIVHDRDVVPHLPPQNIFYEFEHNSREIWFPSKEMTQKNFKKCNFEEFEDKNCSYKLNYYSISDHMNYYNNYVGCEDKEN